ncbi:MAG: tRNA (adenosine(37)-N6)-threonylcarbamoyltransferase complex dimerization subunit type 1 TsaB [Thermodesulfovibrionales bacterium]
MRVLAVETSTMMGGVAIVDDREGLVVESRLSVKAAHSARLMPELDRALRAAGLGLGDINALAVSAGPGSFTGLRIGLATVKGLAFSTGLPVVAVPTLEAFAWCFPQSPHPVCPMLDARKKEVYAGVFAWEGGDLARLVAETNIRAADLARMVEDRPGVLFAGQGAVIYQDEIRAVLGERALFAPPHLMAPMPSAVALVGLARALAGEFSDPRSLGPVYIRKSEAESKAP